ncbi:MAG: hypothetical protein V2I33_17755 [Kangiellaceae bacterium]|nr:hypothetical protein [Kangiellaceae bacterium]
MRDYVDVDGDTPNKGETESDWQLTRRFFIYDNVSGIEAGYATGQAQTSVLQYAKDITLRVQIQIDEDERIFIPLLLIDYKSRLTAYILEDEEEDRVSFTSLYTMDTSQFWLVALCLLTVTNMIAVGLTIVNVIAWSKNNPASYSPETRTMTLAGRALMIWLRMEGLIHFWYIFLFSAYWFIFFKLQYHVFILLPETDKFVENYLPFYVIFSFVVFL